MARSNGCSTPIIPTWITPYMLASPRRPRAVWEPSSGCMGAILMRLKPMAHRLGFTVLAGSIDKPHGLREAYLVRSGWYLWVPDIPSPH